MTQNREKIVICGHYGATNIGDEAILTSLLQNLKKVKPSADITVLSYNPSNTKEFHNVKSNYLIPFGFRSLFRGIFKGELFKTLKTIKNCDKFILGGGGLFTDEKLFAVFLWGIHVLFALKYNKSLYMIGQSVGPLRTGIGEWITKKAFEKAKLISVRDTESKNLLQKLGIKTEVYVVPDLVFGLNFEHGKFDESLNKKIEQNNLKGYFLISLRPWIKNSKKLYKNINQVAAKIVENYQLLPVFIPFQIVNQNDEQLMHNILEQSDAKYPFLVKKFDQNIFNIIELIKRSKFVIGMRLHFIIFSIITMTPFVAISYSPKIKNLLKDLQFQELIINEFEADYMLDKIDFIRKDDFALIESQKSHILNSENDIVEFFKKI